MRPFPDESPPSNDNRRARWPANDNEDPEFLAEVEELKRRFEAEGLFRGPRTHKGNRIEGDWEEPPVLAPDGVTEGCVYLAHSVEGFHYAIGFFDTEKVQSLHNYGPYEIRDKDGSLRWSPAYPAVDAAREQGYAALNRAMRNGQEPIPSWPRARQKEPASAEPMRDREPDIDR